MLFRISTLIAVFFSLPLFAATEVTTLEACELRGQTVLKTPTQIVCMGEFKAEEGAAIITQGNELQIWILGNADFGTPTHGLHISAFDETKILENTSEVPSALGTIMINARSATGFLHVDNRGLLPEHAGGDIALAFGTTDEYEHELLPGRAGVATLIRNGESVALNGPLSKPYP